jgi:outer membrane protein OmpA-like peptidoglycan-associated protein
MRIVEVMSKRAVIAALLALPISAGAEPATRADSDLAAQFATTLTASDGAANKPARAPQLANVTASKAELPGARAADAPKLADGQRVADAPTIGSKFTKVESLGPRPAFQPAPTATGSATRVGSVGHPHRAKLLSFEPGQLRAGSGIGAQVDDLVRSWKTNLKWDAITIDGYAAARGHSEAENVQLAQRSADDVRAYLVRHGVPAELVIAVGHTGASPSAKIASRDSRTASSTAAGSAVAIASRDSRPASSTAAGSTVAIDISVTTCDGVAISCRKPAPAK